MGPKGHLMVQKGLKMHEKRQKIEFLDLKTCFLAELGVPPPPPLNGVFWPKIAVFFLNGIGGFSPPLTESHCAQKSLAERGGTPPLNGKNPLKRF